ncbi:MAG TPA: hypothetical protein VNB89_05930 [Gemmatimonadaceae bacterium]|jgi:hypothetical protein|nr:hypothetical protein [Gemmatimonadaceae bacterium]
MPPDLAHVLPLLQRDVAVTLGKTHRQLIEDIAADVRELNAPGGAEKVVNDVQQYFHDTSVDPTWPACPRHAKHPLWYRDGWWWCVEDGVAVVRLGELTKAG